MKKRSNVFLLTCLLCLSTRLSAQVTPALDPTFGNNGGVILDLGTFQELANAVALQPWDGKIVVAATTNELDGTNAILFRFNPDGSLDTGFGVDGLIPGIFSSLSNRPTDMIILEDHKILVAGNVGDQNIANNTDIILTRLLEDGTPDVEFGTEGIAVVDMDGWDDLGVKIVVQQDQKIVLTTTSFSGFESHMAVARLLPSGALDTTFGTGGKVSVLIGEGPFSESYAVGFQGNKIITAGTSRFNDNNQVTLVRFSESGAIDSTFGSNGVFYFDPHPQIGDFLRGLTVLSNGEILLVTSVSFASSMYLARVNPEGGLDPEFGPTGNGMVYANDCCFTYNTKVQFQADGKILVGGNVAEKIGISRFSANGIPDSLFGQNGAFRSYYNNDSFYPGVLDIALQPDGRLIAAGYSSTWSSSHTGVAIARFDLGAVVESHIPRLVSRETRIYPNPADGHVYIDYDLEHPQAVTVNLRDVSGKTVQCFLQQGMREPGKQFERLAFDKSITPGIYLLEISTDNWTRMLRLVKW